MKKIISILLSITTILIMFAGCVSSNMVTEELPTESATESTTQPAHKTEVPEGYVGIYSVDDFEYIRTTPKGIIF